MPGSHCWASWEFTAYSHSSSSSWCSAKLRMGRNRLRVGCPLPYMAEKPLSRGGIKMGFIWFAMISVMLAAYVILDGFDLGAGALHLFLGRTDEERRKLIRSIGPVWDGNEVWLLATGGVLYFVFPQLYASSFSGFYLPLMMVLWLLMLRAIRLEFRTHIEDRIWASFFDAIFSIGSLLLAGFFGAGLGNVVGGLPRGTDH